MVETVDTSTRDENSGGDASSQHSDKNDDVTTTEPAPEQAASKLKPPEKEEDEYVLEERKARRELIIVISIAVTVLIAVVVAVTVVALQNKPPSPSPAEIVMNNPQQQLDYLHAQIENSTALEVYMTEIPTSVAGLSSDASQPPHVRAAAWAVNQPIYTEPSNMARLFALATLYYSTGGELWTNASNWLTTTTSHCDWYGVTCCRDMAIVPLCGIHSDDAVIEIELSNNNLVGSLPEALNLLTELYALDASFNGLTGPIPGKALGSLPNIGILYLQHNQLTGNVPKQLADSGSLHSLFVQRNDLTGNWPSIFCPRLRQLKSFGLDCEEVDCREKCCISETDCFMDPAELPQEEE